MPEFRRYRDANGAEFTQAVSPELAHSKDWKDITSDDNPAVNTDGKPIAAKPAERHRALVEVPDATDAKSEDPADPPANDAPAAKLAPTPTVPVPTASKTAAPSSASAPKPTTATGQPGANDPKGA